MVCLERINGYFLLFGARVKLKAFNVVVHCPISLLVCIGYVLVIVLFLISVIF